VKIVANLLHGRNHAVDEVEQTLILRFNNEHSMYYDYCHISHTLTIGWMGMVAIDGRGDQTVEGYEALV